MKSCVKSFLVIFIWISFVTNNSSKMAEALSSSGSAPQQDACSSSSSVNNQNEAIPLLPEGDPNDTDIPTIKLGETIRFEEMGPVILNTDGSTRRIENWDQLSEREKEVTWRRISKRNEERRKILLQKQQEQEQEGS